MSAPAAVAKSTKSAAGNSTRKPCGHADRKAAATDYWLLSPTICQIVGMLARRRRPLRTLCYEKFGWLVFKYSDWIRCGVTPWNFRNSREKTCGDEKPAAALTSLMVILPF